MLSRQEIIDRLIPILSGHPIKKAALFGSYARNENTDLSDVDLVVEFDIELPGLEFGSLYLDIVENLDVHVDLCVYGESGMPHDFLNNILRDEMVFYEK